MNASLEHIWHEFADKLGRFIRARVSDPARAEDILAKWQELGVDVDGDGRRTNGVE